jgi:hypothetical protein
MREQHNFSSQKSNDLAKVAKIQTLFASLVRLSLAPLRRRGETSLLACARVAMSFEAYG